MRFPISLALSAIMLLILLPACASQKSAEGLNLTYAPVARAVQGTSGHLAMVKPHYTGPLQVIAEGGMDPGPDYTIPRAYINDYSLRIEQALLVDIAKILVTRGFAIYQPSDSLGNIPDAVKQKADLVVVPSFDFSPQVTNQQNTLTFSAIGSRVLNRGTVQLVGKFRVEFIDPLSTENRVTKTVEVTSLPASVEVEYESMEEAENQFTEMLNKLYPILMKKIEKIMIGDEFQTALENSRHLREKNR